MHLENTNGSKIPTRAILDNRSEVNFLTNDDLLSIQKYKTSVDVLGIIKKITYINLKIQTIISNKDDSFKNLFYFSLFQKLGNR